MQKNFDFHPISQISRKVKLNFCVETVFILNLEFARGFTKHQYILLPFI